VQKVCANPACPVHHPKQKASREDEKWKAEQEKQRKEQAIANTTGLRVLAAVSAAVPVRLMKRDLLFILEKLLVLMDERRIETLARQRHSAEAGRRRLGKDVRCFPSPRR
jgi:ParB family transcriptional regulator, chromosome partitioning protein